MYTVGVQPQTHGRARVTKNAESPLQTAVETDDATWSYAVSFELYPSQSLDGAGEPRIVIDLEVESGVVGIGCTTADYSSYVDRELYVIYTRHWCASIPPRMPWCCGGAMVDSKPARRPYLFNLVLQQRALGIVEQLVNPGSGQLPSWPV